jgi:hypothetical protein
MKPAGISGMKRGKDIINKHAMNSKKKNIRVLYGGICES